MILSGESQIIPTMKIPTARLLASMLASLIWIACANAIDITFYAVQYSGGGSADQYQEGYWPTDNPNYEAYLTYPNSPATSLGMPFFNPWSGLCDFRMIYSTNGATGTYYIGTFDSSSTDFYITIY